MRNPVLLVVDMQKGFLNTHSSHVVGNVVRLVQEFTDRAIPIVFSRFFNTEGSPFETLIGWKELYSEPATVLTDELLSYAEIVVDKNFYTTFTDDFIQLINENKWTTVILCGVATESCVLKTAADAFELDLHPIVVSDACASDMGDEFHLAGLLVLQSLIGNDQIMTTNELIKCFDHN
jgi:nicotinamidase-related amidase